MFFKKKKEDINQVQESDLPKLPSLPPLPAYEEEEQSDMVNTGANSANLDKNQLDMPLKESNQEVKGPQEVKVLPANVDRDVVGDTTPKDISSYQSIEEEIENREKKQKKQAQRRKQK